MVWYGMGRYGKVVYGKARVTCTTQEYQEQRYEAASTIYGPNTLRAYTQQFTRLAQVRYRTLHQAAQVLVAGGSLPPGPPPPDLKERQVSLRPGVLLDRPGLGVSLLLLPNLIA